MSPSLPSLKKMVRSLDGDWQQNKATKLLFLITLRPEQEWHDLKPLPEIPTVINIHDYYNIKFNRHTELTCYVFVM
jgi:hypothetical protein